MKLSEIKNTLDAEVLSGHDQMDMNIVGGGGADLMEDVLSAVAKGAVLLTGLDDRAGVKDSHDCRSCGYHHCPGEKTGSQNARSGGLIRHSDSTNAVFIVCGLRTIVHGRPQRAGRVMVMKTD